MKLEFSTGFDTYSGDTDSSLFSTIRSFDEDIPLQIEPQKGIIEPNSSCIFKVTFSPSAEGRYSCRLISKCQSLHPDSAEMVILVTAICAVPNFYFEVEESDYMTRRPTNLKSLSEDLPNPKIIELESIGLGIICEA